VRSAAGEVVNERYQGDKDEETGVEDFFEMGKGGEVLQLAFGVVSEVGAAAHSVSNVNVDFFELAA
jgi:hypothetical protein